jgi:allantoate deiminase
MTNVEARMTNEVRNPKLEMGNANSLKAAARRVMERCADLAGCTQRTGEITRLFCSDAMREAHGKLRRWMEAAGLRCRLDPAGNLIGRLESQISNGDPRRRVLLLGSHLDTVVNAGKYDGVLGVMLGVAVAELIAESKAELPFALDVIGFSEEEGVRYQTPYIGSRAMIGDLPAELLAKTDGDGVSMAEALKLFGADPARMGEAKYDPRDVIAYIEPHIEQGPVLELGKLPVGIVTGIAGQTRAQFQFVGSAGHAGTVPMNARHDALVAAARLVTAVREIAGRREGAVATVGQLTVAPNVANVIPGEVNLRLDVRHLEDDARDATFREITHQAAVIAEEEEVEFDMPWSQSQPSLKCHTEMIGRLEQSVVEAGIQPFRLASGAGHDAAIMARRFPTAMLFLRCASGLSHHPDESASETDVATALDVLLRFVKDLATETSAPDVPSLIPRPSPLTPHP